MTDRKNPTTLAQLRLGLEKMELGAPGGMSYVIQLCDGRFVIIDGGHDDRDGKGLYAANKATFLAYLGEKSGGGKPVIACWFITHTDSDHIDFATTFLLENRNKVVVEQFAYNYPITDAPWREYDREESFDAAMAGFPNAVKGPVRTGDVFRFADLRVDVLLSAYDRYPEEPDNANQTSAVLRLTFMQDSGDPADDTRAIIMGDCESVHAIRLRDPSSRVYREDAELKADVLQISHHGMCVTGYSTDPEPFYQPFLELYQAIAPSICLWPQFREQFELADGDEGEAWCRSPKYPYHYWLHQSVPKEKHFHHSQTTVVDMKDLSTIVWKA